jgi:aminoglycoside phosphotransferase (APT) family kinase protein
MLEGLPLLGQGRAAEVFALDTKRVIKVARTGSEAALEREAIALRAAGAVGAPAPALHEVGRFDDRVGLVMSRVPGKDMLSDLARRPWTLLRTGAKLGRIHAELHRAPAPAELRSLKAYVEERLTGSLEDAALRDRLRGILHDLPEGERLCHLDFHPGNVIRDGATMTVIDWASAARGDPVADVAFTVMGLEGGEEPPGTPLVTRLFAPAGRALILRDYLRSYRRHAELDEARLARWRVVAAGVRLTYGIDSERPLLRRILEA